ncbi:MAG: hypothetical protein M0Q45_00915 [Bacteroidales bacterium]|nr:hypothetical protein [Bacteroidales bacterium]
MLCDFQTVIFNFRREIFNFIIPANSINSKKHEDELFDDNYKIDKKFLKFLNQLIENDIERIIIYDDKLYPDIKNNEKLRQLFNLFIPESKLSENDLKGGEFYTKFFKTTKIESFKSVVIDALDKGILDAVKSNVGLIVGISSHEDSNLLKNNVADLTIKSFADIDINSLATWFENGLEEDSWIIKFNDFDSERQYYRENFMALGNGYFATRSNFCFEKASDIHFPATYMSGVYNKLISEINAEKISWHEIVNCPNWVFASFKIEEEEWFNFKDVKLIDFERRLDLKKGILSAWFLIEDHKQRKSMLEVIRCVSMDNKNLAGQEFSITPLNYSGKISIKTSLDANITNFINTDCVQKTRTHLLKPTLSSDGNILNLKTKTSESNIEISVSAVVNSNLENASFEVLIDDWEISAVYSSQLAENQEFVVYKNIVYSNSTQDTNLDHNKILKENSHFSIMANQSIKVWEEIWKKFDIQIVGNRKIQKAIRLNIYQVLISTYFLKDQTNFSGIGAGGLQNEAKNGLIYGDQVFIMPFFNINMPEISKSLLLNSYYGLENAKKYAQEKGFEGALFPNITNSKGEELSQKFCFDEQEKKLIENKIFNQNHVSIELAMSVIRYFQATNDKDFMINYGAEMLFEICKFYVSACKYSARDFKYHTENMNNRDTFHTHKIHDNAYINIMLSWVLRRSLNIWHKQNYLFENVDNLPTEKDLYKWREISQNLAVNINNDGIIEQFNGYFKLKEVDWVKYKSQFSDLNDLDKIFKNQGLDIQDYKASNNIDFLLIFYNLSDKEIAETFAGLGYDLTEDYKTKNFYYYSSRTINTSLKSRIISTFVANSLGLKDLCENFINEAFICGDSELFNFEEKQNFTYISDKALILLLLYNIYFGFDFRDRVLSMSPEIPKSWHRAKLNFMFRNSNYKFVFTPNSFSIKTDKDLGLTIFNSPCIIEKDEWWNVDI